MTKLALPGMRDLFAPHQIANGVLPGTEITFHAFRESIAQHGWDPGSVKPFIGARNTFIEVGRLLILDAVAIHALGLARYVHMVYDCAPWLKAGHHLIRFLQETQQGEPLGMDIFSLVVKHMTEELQTICAIGLNIWCTDDGTLVGTISAIAKATEII